LDKLVTPVFYMTVPTKETPLLFQEGT